MPTPYGDVTIEEFELGKARDLDVIFLAVGGDFSKEYAHKLTEGVREPPAGSPTLMIMREGRGGAEGHRERGTRRLGTLVAG